MHRRHKRYRFHPWVGTIPRRRVWQSTPSILAWRIPWTEEPGGLQSVWSQRVKHSWSDLAHGTFLRKVSLKLTFQVNKHVLGALGAWCYAGQQSLKGECSRNICLMRSRRISTHSSVLAWRIPGMGEPGGLPSTVSHKVGHNWSNLAAAAER